MKSLLRLRPYLWKYRRTLFFGFLTIVGSNLFSVVQPLFIGNAIDALKKGLEAKTFVTTDVLMYAGLIVGFTLVSGFFTFLTRQTIIVVSRHIEFDLRNDFLAQIQKLPLSYFQNTPTGDLMAHATNDISAVRNTLGPGIMYPTDTIMTFTLVLTLMLYKDWSLTLLALVPLPLVSLAVYKLSQLVHKKFDERQQKYGELTTRAQENLSGIRVVKAYVRETYEIGLFRNLSWEYMKKNLKLAQVQSIMWPLMFLLVGSSLIITLYFGGLRVIEGRITIGMLAAFFTYLTMLIWPMIAFGWVMNLLQQGAASMGRLCKIWDTVPEIRDTDETDVSVTAIEGDIEFRNVSFNHKNSTTPALHNINLKIERGTSVAIVGPVGSGKTTLVNLIPRLYDVTEGEVLIDGKSVKRIPLKVLRSQISMVPQETFLFSDTIRENISYGMRNGSDSNPAGDNVNESAGKTDGHIHIERAAEIAQITKDVTDFPKQFDTMIGERGITLSGGQKQRTSIARALIRQPKILILDDALSSVDTYTEEEILKRLRSFMKNRTSIIISHRVSTVKDADIIAVLDNGSIVERGTHEQLVAVDGIYADLYYKQLLEEELEQL